MGRFEDGMAGKISGAKALRFFREIRLRTPESVELEFPLAGIGSRAYALLVDYTLISIAMVALMLVGLLFSFQTLAYAAQNPLGFTPSLNKWILPIVLLGLFAIFVGYFVFFETLWQGQTPGKRMAQIRVIREDGRPIGLPQATLRALLRVFDDILVGLVGFLFIVQGRQEKRLGDWVAGTVVIQELRVKKDKDTIVIPDEIQANQVADAMLETANFNLVTPDDFAVIRQYLTRRSRFSVKVRETVSLRLAQQLKARLDLEALPFDMTANLFLEGVYLIYLRQGAR